MTCLGDALNFYSSFEGLFLCKVALLVLELALLDEPTGGVSLVTGVPAV